MVFDGKKRKATLTEIEDELVGALRRRREDISLKFVCENDVRRIWTVERIATISKSYEWAKDTQRVQRDFVKVLSTLVKIHWKDWRSFGDHFLYIPGRSDNDLPLENTALEFLRGYSDSFYAEQYIFTPVVLEDDPISNPRFEYSRYSRHHRMPFLSSELIQGGASGTVTKEEIAPGYFKDRSGVKNGENYCVAVKRFEHKESNCEIFELERENLKLFKECRTRHDNIMLSLTAFAHGERFIIISDLADMDLNIFFKGSYDGFLKRCKAFTAKMFLEEFRCLVNALSFLHDGFQIQDRKVACAHLDLKPENILVKWAPSITSSVSRWMIHDFGISRIKNTPIDIPRAIPGDFLTPGSIPVRQFSPTATRRPPGMFQAPEVQNSQDKVVGIESDMWSCGCILTFVLAFATGGPEGESKLRSTLFQEEAKKNFFYTILEGGKTEVNPAMIKFLQNDEVPWVNQTRNLISNLLKVDPNKRLNAHEVEEGLKTICSETDKGFRGHCSWISKAENMTSQTKNYSPSNSTNQTIVTHRSLEAPEKLTMTDEISFMRFKPPEETLKAVICPTGSHVAFLSKKVAIIYSIASQKNWNSKAPKIPKQDMSFSTANSIPCPDGDWNYVSISGRYVVLRSVAQGGKRERVHRYKFDVDKSPSWEELPWTNSNKAMTVNEAAFNSFDLAISCRGDVLFYWDEKLYCYSLHNGAEGLKFLKTNGKLRSCGASFSPDGKNIYGWTYDREKQKNYWYIWDTQTCKMQDDCVSEYRVPEYNNGRDTLFPLSNYFAVFERPDRLHVIRKTAKNFEARKSETKPRSIIAGASFRGSETGDEALILVSSKPSLILLQMHDKIEDLSCPPCDLKRAFEKSKDGIGVLGQNGDTFVIIAHLDGLIMRRRISINGDATRIG